MSKSLLFLPTVGTTIGTLMTFVIFSIFVDGVIVSALGTPMRATIYDNLCDKGFI
jgi:hypothetical protein